MARKARFDRETALKQAMNLFWSRGYHATSLKDIEAALDMRPGSIYAAFGSKEALFKAALDLYAETGRDRLEDTLAQGETPLQGLAQHVRNLGVQISGAGVPSRACMLMKTVLETPDDDPVLRAAAEELMGQTEAAFAAAFEAARLAGQIAEDSDPELLAARLQSEILGLRAYAQRSDTQSRVQRLVTEIAHDLETRAM